ncbi:MAG TPA: DUF2914 domain-containing protein [Candidatus Paceibacterota bacterium]|nr:DUF2914 domain-containing protein [Candidatus Paceibacterota bacterium]
MNTALTSLLAWAKRNERHLSSLFFLSGFIGDIIAFTLLDVSIVNLVFAVYLGLAALAILVSHYLFSHYRDRGGRAVRTLSLLLPLFVQYAVGAILSGSLIFYTKSADVFVSWPFLVVLAIVFFGNEVFRNYREHLAFQTMLFFFGLYAYAIFALPLLLGRLGPQVFIFSTISAGLLMAAFLLVLYRVGQNRFRESFRAIVAGSATIVVAINIAYVTGLIPPLPLALKEASVHHQVTRVDGGYKLLHEPQKPWWEFYTPTTVHHVEGTPLSVYSAVYAPVRFSAAVVHVWEWFDESSGKWVEKSRVSFPVSGGREDGYRGYSEKSNPEPGKWRVSIRTPEGQTIGRTSFIVVKTANRPTLVEERK